jgi:hypothetical protein
MPNTERETGTSMGIAWDAQLPLSWAPDAQLDATARLTGFDLQIEDTLQAVNGLEDMRTPVADDAAPSGQGLARLEFKLNLVLELLSELISQSQERPPPHQVRVGARQVSWTAVADNAPAVGETGTLELYVHPLYVRPLRLPGRINSVDVKGDQVQVTMALFELEPVAQEALERWLFLHHRRSVAQIRPGKM